MGLIYFQAESGEECQRQQDAYWQEHGDKQEQRPRHKNAGNFNKHIHHTPVIGENRDYH
jgi:hypothetical protein